MTESLLWSADNSPLSQQLLGSAALGELVNIETMSNSLSLSLVTFSFKGEAGFFYLNGNLAGAEKTSMWPAPYANVLLGDFYL